MDIRLNITFTRGTLKKISHLIKNYKFVSTFMKNKAAQSITNALNC